MATTTTKDGYEYRTTKGKNGPNSRKAIIVLPDKSDSRTHQCVDEDDAQRWIGSKLVELREESHRLPAAPSVTFGEFAESKFWPVHQGRKNKERRRHYDLYVADRWASVPLEHLGPKVIMDWIDELRVASKRKQPKGKLPGASDEIIGESYVHQIYYSAFSSIVTDARNRGYLSFNPLPPKPGLAKGDPKRARILKPHEIEYLASTIEQKARDFPGRYRHQCVVPDWPVMHYTLVYTLAYAGLRISEALALTVSDLDYTSNPDIPTLRVDEQIAPDLEATTDLKTKRSRRIVPITVHLRDLLLRNIEVNNRSRRSALMFTTKLGGPIQRNNWAQRWMGPAVEACGLEDGEIVTVTPHTLRHVAATAWHEAGYSIIQIAQFLGERVETVEDTYVKTNLWPVDSLDEIRRRQRMDERFTEGLG